MVDLFSVGLDFLGLVVVSVSALVISRSNSSRARLNSPVLFPIPRASCGSFLAPKRRSTMRNTRIISCPPKAKASV